MNELYMGIDIGTSGVRAVLFDAEGRQIAIEYKEYPMICTQPGMYELDPFVVFSAFLEVAGKCVENSGADSSHIQAIGLSTQLFSFLAVDGNGNCLTNLITWADGRSLKQAESVSREFDCKTLYNATGCRVQHPMYPLSKILWLRETQPDIFKKTYKFVSIKEYIIFRLFGDFYIDYTDASATACFNIHSFDWDEYILSNILGVKKDSFGEAIDCTFTLKGMRREYAEAMGLREDIPVAIGAGDGILANVGCGVFDDTSMSCTIGTSGALRIAVGKPLLDERQRTWCYCFTKDTWVAGGAVNNGGIVLKWLRDNFREQFRNEAENGGYPSIYALFDKYASEIPAGSEGLIFLPLLTGERSPNWNARARGILCGLDLSHSPRHFVKAAMEGVIYRMFSIYEIIGSLSGKVKQIKANGGYTNSDVWLQIQADIFEKEIAVAGVEEAASFGAAYTAMAAVGAVGSLKQPLPAMQVSRIVHPNEENAEVYREGYRQFNDLYKKMFAGG